VGWLPFVGLRLALVPVALDVAWVGLPVVGFVGWLPFVGLQWPLMLVALAVVWIGLPMVGFVR